jgi:hypothetical protein
LVSFSILVHGSVVVEGNADPKSAIKYFKQQVTPRIRVDDEDAEEHSTEVVEVEAKEIT